VVLSVAGVSHHDAFADIVFQSPHDVVPDNDKGGEQLSAQNLLRTLLPILSCGIVIDGEDILGDLQFEDEVLLVTAGVLIREACEFFCCDEFFKKGLSRLLEATNILIKYDCSVIDVCNRIKTYLNTLDFSDATTFSEQLLNIESVRSVRSTVIELVTTYNKLVGKDEFQLTWT